VDRGGRRLNASIGAVRYPFRDAEAPARNRRSSLARKGDLITVNPARVGQLPRQGEIIEVIEGDLRARYRVRWNDGHESLFAPSAGGASIEPARDRKKTGSERTKTRKWPEKASPARTSRAKAVPAKKLTPRRSSGKG
jgi:hypothetical protein